MELVKKPIRSYRTIDIVEPEEMFEHNIIVPDVKPDIKSILLADAEGFVNNVEKTGRMVEVSGEIQYKILYIADTPEQKVESITARYPWSFSLQKPKVEGDIGAFARCRCQHTDVNIVNGRKIVCRTVTSLICRFYDIKSNEIGREILGENVFLKTSPVNVMILKDNGDINVRVNDVLALPPGSPPIKEILFSRINLGNSDINYRDDEPMLEAKANLFILYRSDSMDESIETVVLEFPVKTSTGVQVSEFSTLFATNVLKDWEIKMVEDDDGLFTRLSVTLDVEIDAQTMVSEEQLVIEDAYSCDHRLDLDMVPVKVVNEEKEFCEEYLLTQRINLNIPEDPLDEVLMVCPNERNIASMLSDNLNVHGTVGINLLFLTRNKEFKGHMLDLPFNHIINLPDTGKWQVVQSLFTIEDIQFDIAGIDSIDLSIRLKIKVRVCRVGEIVSTDSISVVKEENAQKAPITIYFSQPGDDLWDIAKNYRIPVFKLCADNGLDEEDSLETGKRLFILS
ncbi:MAG: DUF3794 domain-containing protein [Clostridiaceae bacterium]|nr:DUF3794 domain-containing protein [Clostridiaceae bacterium]